MALPYQFASVTAATGAQLDATINAAGKLGQIPCAITGTNALALTPTASITPDITAYSNYMLFAGIAPSTNTTVTTAAVGALAALNVYKDGATQPGALSGGEIVASCAVILMYDSALNGGIGGFHLVSSGIRPGTTAKLAGLQFGGGATLFSMLTTSSTISFGSLVPQASSQSTIALASCSIGDIVMVAQPSVASVGIIFDGFVQTAGSVVIRAHNLSAATVTPSTGPFRIVTQRYV